MIVLTEKQHAAMRDAIMYAVHIQSSFVDPHISTEEHNRIHANLNNAYHVMDYGFVGDEKARDAAMRKFFGGGQGMKPLPPHWHRVQIRTFQIEKWAQSGRKREKIINQSTATIYRYVAGTDHSEVQRSPVLTYSRPWILFYNGTDTGQRFKTATEAIEYAGDLRRSLLK